jgi:uncharacterized protein (DUF2252 family)
VKPVPAQRTSPAERAELGKRARAKVPRARHAEAGLAASRPDVVGLLEEQARSRVPGLVPVRYGRMLVSPFTFYRGAALPMASDLAGTPVSGITVQACGDAHLSNFGIFGTPERNLVFDINDFDETLPAPWEWDVKRLAASLEVAGRDNGFTAKQRRPVTLAAVRRYREAMRAFAAQSNLDVFYARADVDQLRTQLKSQLTGRQRKVWDKNAAKARTADSMRAMRKLATIVDDVPKIVADPPLIVPLDDLTDLGDRDVEPMITGLLSRYRRTLEPDRRHLLGQYEVADIARKVVGVGSVGTRCWIVLLFGRDGTDPLFLQVKEAQPSVLAPYAGKSKHASDGQRVVAGQRLMQAAGDALLGWIRTGEGLDGEPRSFYVRQLRDWKMSLDVAAMLPDGMRLYGEMCGWTLARAHARSGDRIAIAAYLGGSDVFDRAVADFADAYASQNERDYQALVKAETTGRIAVERDLLHPMAKGGAMTNTVDFELGFFPVQRAAHETHGEQDLRRALEAYHFFYPTVSMEGIFRGTRNTGAVDNESAMLITARPWHVGFTLNSDTPYAGGVLDVHKSGPMVIELPPGPLIGLVDDHYHRWITDLGLPGLDAGHGGKHLLLPPGWDQPVPDGYLTGRSDTWQVLLALRALPVNGDVEAALSLLRSVRIYPLAGESRPYEFVENNDGAADITLLAWEDNMEFWQVLHSVIGAEPPIEEMRPALGMLAELGIEAGKPFEPDEATMRVLTRAARQGRDEMLVSAFASRRPDRVVWPDRAWEWIGLRPENADFEREGSLDVEARDRWFAQAIVASPAMFRRTEGAGSLYWLACRDAHGEYLDGGRTYRLTVPLPVPASLFWSVTCYDSETRSEVAADQGQAALRSLFNDLDGGDSVDLYFGPTEPAQAGGRWLQTVPGRGWFCYFRIYGPGAAAFDGSWKPGDMIPVR